MTAFFALCIFLPCLPLTVYSEPICHNSCKTCYENGKTHCESCEEGKSTIYNIFHDFIYDITILKKGRNCSQCHSSTTQMTIVTHKYFTYNLCFWEGIYIYIMSRRMRDHKKY